MFTLLILFFGTYMDGGVAAEKITDINSKQECNQIKNTISSAVNFRTKDIILICLETKQTNRQ